MRKAITSTAMLRPFGPPKVIAALGALPRNPRTMLAYDASLAWATLLLLAAGLVMVYSASIAMAEASAYTGYRPWYFLARHAIFVVAGLLAALVAFQVPLKGWQRVAPSTQREGRAGLSPSGPRAGAPFALLLRDQERSTRGPYRWRQHPYE